MGAADLGCNRLRRVEHAQIFCLSVFLILAFFGIVGNANAQIIPLRGTLAYSSSSAEMPVLTVKAANGSPAYALTFYFERDTKSNLVGIDLVLHRPRASDAARNLLEPPYRWHGLQEYMFLASEFAEGADSGPYGASREIRVRNRKLDVKFTVTKAEAVPVKDPVLPTLNYAFKEFVIDVTVDNLK